MGCFEKILFNKDIFVIIVEERIFKVFDMSVWNVKILICVRFVKKILFMIIPWYVINHYNKKKYIKMIKIRL